MKECIWGLESPSQIPTFTVLRDIPYSLGFGSLDSFFLPNK